MKMILVMAGIGLLTACSKEMPTLDSKKEWRKTQVSEQVEGQLADQELEESMKLGLEWLGDQELLFISVNSETGKIEWDVLDKTKTDNQIQMKAAHDCEGSAISVAKCAKEIIDNGGCVLAGETAGEYWADHVDNPKRISFLK